MSSRKHKAISLEEKKRIIDASENKYHSELAKDFNKPRSTIQGNLKDRKAILQAIEDGGNAKRAKLNKGKNEELEEALLVWIKQVLSQNIDVTGELIKKKTKEIVELLNIDNFEASNGWLEGFKNRFSIKQLSKQEEAGSIDVGSLKVWQQQILREDLAKFSPDDIYNSDETALFWQFLPNKTLSVGDWMRLRGEISKICEIARSRNFQMRENRDFARFLNNRPLSSDAIFGLGFLVSLQLAQL